MSSSEVEWYCLTTSASLSLIGSVIVIYLTSAAAAVNSSSSTTIFVSQRIIKQMAFAGAGTSTSFLLSSLFSHFSSNNNLCKVQAIGLEFFYLSLYIWTACFAHHVMSLLYQQQNNRNLRHYVALAWGIPGVFCCILLSRHESIESEPWCFHSSSLIGKWKDFGYFYIAVIIVFCINLFLYFKILRRENITKNIRRRVVAYGAVFFLTSVWGLCNRYFTNTKFLSVMESIWDPLTPFLNSLVYATNAHYASVFKKKFSTICSCCSNKEEDNTTVLSELTKESLLLNGKDTSNEGFNL